MGINLIPSIYGCRQAVRPQTLTLVFRWFKSSHPCHMWEYPSGLRAALEMQQTVHNRALVRIQPLTPNQTRGTVRFSSMWCALTRGLPCKRTVRFREIAGVIACLVAIIGSLILIGKEVVLKTTSSRINTVFRFESEDCRQQSLLDCIRIFKH